MNIAPKQPFAVSKALPWLISAALAWPAMASAEGAVALEGTWDVAVTLRNCTTGAAIRSFPRLITFAKGGTLTEWAAAGTEAAPAARGVGQGAWEYLGEQQFAYSLKFLRLTPSGGPDGFFQELRELEVGESGDSYAGEGVAHITLANGFVIGPLCATEAGTRLF